VEEARVIQGDCRNVLPALPAASFDVVFTDPPYPCIKRQYGTWTEAEWFGLMRAVVPEVRRVLKPSGSAVFVLQPNSEHIGRMRTWLWEFLAWVGKEWGIVQDAYWWNITATVTEGAGTKGTLRPSVKACVWCGPPGCYRNQDAVLWEESDRNRAERLAGRCTRRKSTCGRIMNDRTGYGAAGRRGGVTPFNLIPTGGCNRWNDGGGTHGHGASTPMPLCSWWLKYLCPPGGVVLDPFAGSGTAGVAALRLGASFVGIEVVPEYVHIARKRLDAELAVAPLFAGAGATA
jgi:hypothetical protein